MELNGGILYGRKNKCFNSNNKKVIICCPIFEKFWKHKYYFMFEKCKYNSTCQQSVQDVQVLQSPLNMICNSKKITSSKSGVNLGLGFKF